jgi:hypothetical protein
MSVKEFEIGKFYRFVGSEYDLCQGLGFILSGEHEVVQAKDAHDGTWKIKFADDLFGPVGGWWFSTDQFEEVQEYDVCQRIPMKTVTEWTRNAGVADRWKHQYYNGEEWFSDDKELIYNKLVALGPYPLTKDIEGTIGNNSWTTDMCSQCLTYAKTVIKIDVENSVTLCEECLNTALRMIRLDK